MDVGKRGNYFEAENRRISLVQKNYGGSGQAAFCMSVVRCEKKNRTSNSLRVFG